MTFLGVPRAKDSNEEVDSSESLTTSENVWREVEFESDADHREMTRTYACDDYLSRWLPNIKREGEEPQGQLRKERSEKRQENEYSTRLFKSPCHHHEKRKSTMRDNKTQHDSARKTYFEAIKCSPMKLRQSLATFKSPNFTLKPNQDTTLHPRPTLNIPGATEAATDLSNSTDSIETEHTSTETKSPKTTLGIVEMHNDETGQLGSLCFRRSLPENYYAQNMYTPCNMVGGKLRKINRETENALLTGRKHHKELLVRCESIMIYPKVLVNQKQQSDKLKFATKPERPKEAWQDRSEQLLPETSQEHTRLPQLTTKQQDQAHNQTHQANNKTSSPEVPLDNPKGQPPSTETRPIQNSASTKIIIPFGECGEKNSKKSPTTNGPGGSSRKEEGVEATMKTVGRSKEYTGERGIPTRCLKGPKLEAMLRKEGEVETSIKMVGENKEYSGERGIPKRCLKESSKLNEQTPSTRRHSDIILGVKQLEMDRKLPVATQYLTVATASSPLKRFRIPTGVENTELFVKRESYSPKKTPPYRFSYSQRGLSEFSKGLEGVAMKQRDCEDNSGHKVSLKIGGRGLMKTRLVREGQESMAEDEGKRRSVQFLLQNSRYFTS